MPTTRRPRAARVAALAAAASVALAGALVPAAVSQAAPASGIDVAPDYLVATYGLPSNHVIETVTFERFEWLLNGRYENNTTPVTGTFAFLIGGAYDANTRATIGYIDEVARQYGVEKVYTFDPALDGDSLNVFDASGAPLDAAGRAPVEALGTRLLTYLNADTTPGFTRSSTDPYLFIYDRSHTVDVAGAPTEDRIVASLNVRQTAASLTDPADVTAYKAQVAAVFDSVAVAGVAQTDELDQFAFWKAEANRRHTVSYTNASLYGSQILSDSDDDAGWRVQTLTYPELEFLLQQSGDYAILFGGTWCHNTRAVIKQINREAQDAGVPVVYNFDNSLDSTGNGSTNYLHIRDNPAIASGGTLPRRASYLYGDLWNTYLTNVVTQYRTSTSEAWTGSSSPVQFYPGGDTSQALQLARKGQVPFLLTYNKDNTEGGVSAPVTSQWIQQNAGTGGWTEYMTEWWNTPTGGSLSGSTSALAFGTTAENALISFFGNLPNGAGVAPQAPAAPTASVSGDAVTVTWTAPALAAASTVSSRSTVTGYQVSIDGGTPVSLGRTLRTYTFSGVAPGSHTATVTAVSPAGSSTASAASNSVTVVAAPTAPDAPTAPTASVTGDSVTVTWSTPSNGGSAITGYKVALDGGTPVPVGAVLSHTFTGVAIGAHTATVVAVNVIGSSTASPASNSVTVTAPVDPATVVGTVGVGGSLSQGGTVTITGSGFAPDTTFDVEIHSTPQALGSVTTNSLGAFTFTTSIPSNVPAGTHSIVVLYNGAIVSSSTISVAANGLLAATGLDERGLTNLTLASILALLVGGSLAAAGLVTRRRRSA